MSRIELRHWMGIAASLAALAPAGHVAAQGGVGQHNRDLLSIQVYAVGGGFIPFTGRDSVSSLDLDADSALPSASGGTSTTTPLLGARVHVPLLWYMSDTGRLAFNFYFESGLQSGFGAQSLLRTFQNASPTAEDYGTTTVREYWQVPVLLGLTVPVANDSSASPLALLDIYGGLTFDSWAHLLQGAEVNASDGSGFFGQNRHYTFNPTIGLGVRMPLGRVDSDVPVFFGLNAELQLRPGSVVAVPSSDFNVVYSSSIEPYANLAVMARIGIAFGGR